MVEAEERPSRREIIPMVKLPIGPMHPALEEPISLRIGVEGEQIVDVDIRDGYNHRGLEWLGMQRNWIQLLYLAERLCGICSFSHQFAYVQAVETVGEVEVPDRAHFIRVITGEMERVHNHWLWAGLMAHEIGHDTLFQTSWRMREKVMDMLEVVSGNRVHYSIPTIGGVRRDIEPYHIPMFKDFIDYYRERIARIIQLFEEDPTIQRRLKDTGLLSEKDARRFSVVGPLARGSGVAFDVRQDEANSAYEEIGVTAITPGRILGKTTGDVYDRTIVRLYELMQSIDIIERALELIPDGPIRSQPSPMKVITMLKKAAGDAVGRYEAPRGELIHYVRADKKIRPARWKVRSPTQANLHSVATMLMGEQVADIPVIFASIDPCICCTDRIQVIDQDTGTTTRLTADQLTNLSRKNTEEMCR